MSDLLAVTIIDRAGETLGGFIPRLAGALVLLLAGLVVAWLLGRIARRALEAVGADDLAARHGVDRALGRVGLPPSISRVAGRTVRLVVGAVTVFAALSLLGLQFLSTALNEVLLYIPSVVVAIVLVLAGIVLAELARERTQRLSDEMDLPVPLAQLVGLAVLGVFLLTAATQLRVPTQILTLLLAILLAAAAGTVALAFGLGGRDAARALSAGRYVQGAYAIGQTISLDGARGEIVALEPTAVVLRTAPDATVRVPNHRLLDAVVTVHEPAAPAG
jgi:small-conductance mechanosensitive channel